MIQKATLECKDDFGAGNIDWYVMINGFRVSGPYNTREIATNWIHSNGFVMVHGQWIKEVPIF